MEWILCSFCRKEYGAKLDGCPHCGMPQTTDEVIQKGLAEHRAEAYARSDRILGTLFLAGSILWLLPWLIYLWPDWNNAVAIAPSAMAFLCSLWFLARGPQWVVRFLQKRRRRRS